jgi:FkbM family methyltransferase
MVDEKVGLRAFELQAADNLFFERLVRSAYEAIIRPGDTAVDIGGNWGLHAFPMLNLVGLSGHMYVAEPIPSCIANFVKEFARLGASNAHIIPLALSDTEGPTDFFVHPERMGCSGLVKRPDMADEFQLLRTYKTMLDRVIPQSLRPTFIKIDVEGTEFSVLRGAAETLRRSRSIVALEFSPAISLPASGLTFEGVFEFLASFDYQMMDVFGDEWTLETRANTQRPWYSVLAPSSRREEMQAMLSSNLSSCIQSA